MDAKRCLEILREIKDVTFSTVDDDGFPQARIIDVMYVNEKSLYFCTSRGKEFHHQLITNNRVVVTGLNSLYQMVRLNGMAKLCENQKEWIDRIFELNPSMKSVYPNDSRYILDAFYIEDAQIEFFDLGVEPIFRETFSIGKQPLKDRGFVISDDCIGCGKCQKACPQQCIVEGKPFSIQQNHCLHCGLCFENCPVSAIKRL